MCDIISAYVCAYAGRAITLINLIGVEKNRQIVANKQASKDVRTVYARSTVWHDGMAPVLSLSLPPSLPTKYGHSKWSFEHVYVINVDIKYTQMNRLDEAIYVNEDKKKKNNRKTEIQEEKMVIPFHRTYLKSILQWTWTWP